MREFKVITCNYSYRRWISLSYDIRHLPSIEVVYDIIRDEKVSTFFKFFVECILTTTEVHVLVMKFMQYNTQKGEENP